MAVILQREEGILAVEEIEEHWWVLLCFVLTLALVVQVDAVVGFSAPV